MRHFFISRFQTCVTCEIHSYISNNLLSNNLLHVLFCPCWFLLQTPLEVESKLCRLYVFTRVKIFTFYSLPFSFSLSIVLPISLSLSIDPIFFLFALLLTSSPLFFIPLVSLCLSPSFSSPLLAAFDLWVLIWQRAVGAQIPSSWEGQGERAGIERWREDERHPLLPVEGLQFPQGELHLGVQPAVRTAHTRAHNLLLITCYQNLITPKIDVISLGRWWLFSPT